LFHVDFNHDFNHDFLHSGTPLLGTFEIPVSLLIFSLNLLLDFLASDFLCQSSNPTSCVYLYLLLFVLGSDNIFRSESARSFWPVQWICVR